MLAPLRNFVTIYL